MPGAENPIFSSMILNSDGHEPSHVTWVNEVSHHVEPIVMELSTADNPKYYMIKYPAAQHYSLGDVTQASGICTVTPEGPVLKNARITYDDGTVRSNTDFLITIVEGTEVTSLDSIPDN